MGSVRGPDCDVSCCDDDCDWMYDCSSDHRVLLPVCEAHRKADSAQGSDYLVVWSGLSRKFVTWEPRSYYLSKLSDKNIQSLQLPDVPRNPLRLGPTFYLRNKTTLYSTHPATRSSLLTHPLTHPFTHLPN